MVSQLKRVEGVSQTSVVIDPLAVVEEVFIDFKSNCHGPLMDQLQLHQGFIAAPVETPHVVILGGVVTEAAFLRCAWRIGACVGEASLFYQPKILCVLSCNEVWEATFTA